MPEVFSPLGQPFVVHQADRPHLTTSTLGAGYCRTTTYGSRENLRFTFVAVEYFTKWIEARAVSTITSKTTQKFF
jgi:hypothetical protein